MDQHYLKQELDREMQRSSQYFEFLQRGSLDGIWYWDLENPEHEWLSPEFWQLLGFDPATKQHLASEWQDLIDPEDLETAKINLRMHLDDPNHPYDQVVRYKHRNGSTVWVRCRGIAVRNEAGKPVRLLGAHNDLTKLVLSDQMVVALKMQIDSLKMGISALQMQLATRDRQLKKLTEQSGNSE